MMSLLPSAIVIVSFGTLHLVTETIYQERRAPAMRWITGIVAGMYSVVLAFTTQLSVAETSWMAGWSSSVITPKSSM